MVPLMVSFCYSQFYHLLTVEYIKHCHSVTVSNCRSEFYVFGTKYNSSSIYVFLLYVLVIVMFLGHNYMMSLK